MKKKLIVLTGPTAVGKTELSISLAKAVNGEIISADSMQVYRHMDIGSAKIMPEEMDGIRHHLIDVLEPWEEFNVTRFQVSADSMQVYRHMDIGSAKIMPEEMDGIRHHLIDVLEPWEEFNVTRFQVMAREAMEGIYARGHVPIVTGGTGFYIQALAYSIDFTENEDTSHIREELEQEAKEKGPEYLHGLLRQVDPDSAEAIHPNNVKRVIRADTSHIREELEQEAKEKGPEYLHGLLRQVDPDSAEAIHPNNVKRVIRAIEFYRLTGQQISSHNRKERQKESPYDLFQPQPEGAAERISL